MLQNPQLHYLDNAATTIVAPEVADVINKAMREHWANPSSLNYKWKRFLPNWNLYRSWSSQKPCGLPS